MCYSSKHNISYKIMNIISKNFFSTVFLLLASVLVGCSGNDPADTIGNADPTTDQGVSFSLTEPDFGEEETMGVCSCNWKNAVDTTDLGDGVLGEVSMSKEQGDITMRAATRTLSNGRYTVLAYDASGSLKAKINATVVSGEFSSKDIMILEPATYTFVCLNDKVNLSESGIISVSQANAATARIGRTVMSVSGTRMKVPFVMYHVGLRVRVSLEAMVNIPNKVKAMIFDDSGNTPTVTNYDPITGTYSAGAVGTFSGPEEIFPSTGSTDFSKEKYISSPNSKTYHYLLPNQSSSIQLKFTSGDQIYHKDLAGRTMTPYKNMVLEPNATYLLNVKLTKVFKYVFDDGTVGFLRNKGTRKPIALVISETDRSAIALHDANNGVQTIWTVNRRIYNNPVAEHPSQRDQIPATSQGLHWTWDASGSKDGVTIKANELEKCPAFYHAAHYDPGVVVTGTNLSKWYLGANTDWKNLYLYVGFGTNTKVNAASSVLPWYYHVIDKAFTDAGGTTVSIDPNTSSNAPRKYWSATYYRDFNTGLLHIFKNGRTDGNHSLSDRDLALVRAFIHY